MTALPDVAHVARRFACRPGCRFVEARGVGIAVFAMDLRVVVHHPKDIPPIDEFLLRSLKLSVDSPDELAAFLGLDPRTVNDRLVELRRAELIELVPQDDPAVVRCRLTSRGDQVANSLSHTELREITLPRVKFHGILRRSILVSDSALLRPNELREASLAAIPAIPSRPPKPEEIRLDELAAVVRNEWQRKNKGHPPELITVRSILRNVQTRYLPAVMLEYETTGVRRTRQLGFAVDGILDTEAERAFAECKGSERIPDLVSDGYATTAELAKEFLPPHIVQQLGPLNDVDELVEKIEEAEGRLADKQSKVEAEDRPDTKLVLKQEVEALKADKAKLESQVAQSKARRLRTYDCGLLFRTTVRSVKERLVIVSAFVSTEVVNDQFQNDLEAALARGVKVWIGYGMPARHNSNEHEQQRRNREGAERRLRAIQQRYPESCRVDAQGQTHEKVLIKDSEFLVEGSFNWLSFCGDPNRGCVVKVRSR